MLPLTTLYDDYIDRPKLFEKKPFEYIVPLALKWVGTKIEDAASYANGFKELEPSLQLADISLPFNIMHQIRNVSCYVNVLRQDVSEFIILD